MCANLNSPFTFTRHSTIAGWFDQYTKEKYEDVDGVLYKPDLRDFILFMKHHRWHETISLHKLETLRLEFENKKIPTVEVGHERSTKVTLKNCQSFMPRKSNIWPRSSPLSAISRLCPCPIFCSRRTTRWACRSSSTESSPDLPHPARRRQKLSR